MVASGFAALGYQIVWTQQSALWLGHDAAAVFAVVTAFFGGLAAGAWILGARIERSDRPDIWYAACEATIAAWALLLVLFMAPVTDWLIDLTGARASSLRQWSVAFAGTFVVLLPATAAMGATLPAMERLLGRWGGRGSTIAALYAGNTLGAVLGVLVTAFWLVPSFGLTRSTLVCAALNAGCCIATIAVLRDLERPHEQREVARRPRGGIALLAATGLLGVGYEVLVVRVLSQVTENTVFTFAMLLATYLVGTTFGAALYHHLSASDHEDRLADRLLWLTAIACALGTASLWAAPTLKAELLGLAGGSFGAALAAEAVLAVMAFLPPTILMGMLFSHLCTRARRGGVSFGRSLGANTLGAATAPALFGVVVLPSAGARLALLAVIIGYLALISTRSWVRPAFLAAIVAVVAAALWAPSLAPPDVPPGGRVVSYREGVMATVSVLEDGYGVSRLHINNRVQEGSSATRLADGRQAVLPLLLHAGPRNALFLGLGTGVTATTAAQSTGLQVDAVELLPEVIDASTHFRAQLVDPGPGMHVITADARRYVRSTRRRYDLIVADNFHPARSGSGSLYTVEHFAAIRERMAPGGVFCQWLPLHQLDLDTLRSIVRSFLAAHPQAWALLSTYSRETPVVGLVATRGVTRFELPQLQQRLAGIAMPDSPADFGIDDDLALLGTFVAGPAALQRFAATAPLNTDDQPVVAYLAPRLTYSSDSRPADRLAALLDELAIEPRELLASSTDDAWTARLAAYWSARNQFISAGRNVEATSDVEKMLAQVREPLLGVLQTSADFRPAYDPLLAMAEALGRIDPAAAKSLLQQLMQLQPGRPEAHTAFQRLESAAALPP